MQALRIVEPPGLYDAYPIRQSAVRTRNRGAMLFRSTTSVLQSVWEHTVDGMVVTDGEGMVIAVNKAFCALVGMQEHELVGRSYTAFSAMRHGREEGLRAYQRNFKIARLRNTSRSASSRMTAGKSMWKLPIRLWKARTALCCCSVCTAMRRAGRKPNVN